jgi:hypothetical protein
MANAASSSNHSLPAQPFDGRCGAAAVKCLDASDADAGCFDPTPAPVAGDADDCIIVSVATMHFSDRWLAAERRGKGSRPWKSRSRCVYANPGTNRPEALPQAVIAP